MSEENSYSGDKEAEGERSISSSELSPLSGPYTVTPNVPHVELEAVLNKLTHSGLSIAAMVKGEYSSKFHSETTTVIGIDPYELQAIAERVHARKHPHHAHQQERAQAGEEDQHVRLIGSPEDVAAALGEMLKNRGTGEAIPLGASSRIDPKLIEEALRGTELASAGEGEETPDDGNESRGIDPQSN